MPVSWQAGRPELESHAAGLPTQAMDAPPVRWEAAKAPAVRPVAPDVAERRAVPRAAAAVGRWRELHAAPLPVQLFPQVAFPGRQAHHSA